MASATLSDNEARQKMQGAATAGAGAAPARQSNGHEALDLAETAEATSKQTAERLVAKRVEHQRARDATRSKFEEQMRQLEAEQAAEERQILSSTPERGDRGGSASAPTTPPGGAGSAPAHTTGLAAAAVNDGSDSAPIGSGRGAASAAPGGEFGHHSIHGFHPASGAKGYAQAAQAGAALGSGPNVAMNGAKSMPGSRRTSGYGSGAFNMEKLSLSVMEAGKTIGARGKEWKEEDELDEQGAQSSVKYLGMNDDDYPSLSQRAKPGRRLSAASAALDLAPLSQTPPRAFGQRPFETGLKTSEWSSFPSGPAASGAQHINSRTATSPLQHTSQTALPLSTSATSAHTLSGSRHAGAAADDYEALVAGGARKSVSPPSGMADSIASLPAMPSKTTAGPYGPGGAAGARRAGASPGVTDGIAQGQRGFSNPDLARAFGGPGNFGLNDNNFGQGYGSMYQGGPLPPHAAVAAAFTPQVPFDPYGFNEEDGYGSGSLYPGGSIGLKNKRAETDREFNRFQGVPLKDLEGELLALCKDQHGCRYLQKQLEEGTPAQRDQIFRETYGHFPELMTDPFGNYLCQKLLEYSTDEQRTAIIESVANDLVSISLNMHGTRAVQKMVDFLANPRQPKQIRMLIYALSVNVVALIKDLNGNHVIQKCLNKLVPEDNQFIYNAIASNLIEVATHRHGCCVLQRSIDHASPAQRVQLVTEIIFNSLYLVQDPFGNYVIQYILDLNDARFSEPLIRTFIGNVCSLSVQKFSSNVVEKCIRVADPEVRRGLVEEVLDRSKLEKLLRDSYGNYVIQTILDYCEMKQRVQLINEIRPALPSIRNTPYGKRIQSKLAREDSSFNSWPMGPGGGGGGGRGGYRGHHDRSSYGPDARNGHGGGGRGHYGNAGMHHGGHGMNDLYGVGLGGGPGGYNAPPAPFGGAAAVGGMGFGAAPPHGHPGQHQQGLHPMHHHHAAPPHPHHHHHGGPPMRGGSGAAAGGYRGSAPAGAAGAAVGGSGALSAEHTGMSFHAPGPDGQPWLHLRGLGPAGGPAPNWVVPGSVAGVHPTGAPADMAPDAAAAAAAAAQQGQMWDGYYPAQQQQAPAQQQQQQQPQQQPTAMI